MQITKRLYQILLTVLVGTVLGVAFPAGGASRAATGSPAPEPGAVATWTAIDAQPAPPPPGLPRSAGAVTRDEPVPGADRTFWAYDFATTEYYQLRATLEHTSNISRIYVEAGRRVPPSTIKELATLFEEQVYPRLRNRFGHEPEPGIDGERAITLLLLDIRDPLGRGQAPFTYYSGYFDPNNEWLQADLEARDDTRSRRSNEREMVYLDVDPTPPTLAGLGQTMAHEFAHLISWNYDPAEELWLNEGLSELAIHVAGLGHPSEHVEAFLARPEDGLADWRHRAEDYGRVYLFLLYFYEQAEQAADRGDPRAAGWPKPLVQDPAHGLASVLAHRPGLRSPAELFRDWAVALHVDDPTLADGRFGFAGIDLGGGQAGAFPAVASHPHSTYPLVESRYALPPWSIRSDRFTGGPGAVELLVEPSRELCAGAAALPILPSPPGATELRSDCGSAERALGWTFEGFRPGGHIAAIEAIVANASDKDVTVALSALPPMGGFHWYGPPLLFPIAVR